MQLYSLLPVLHDAQQANVDIVAALAPIIEDAPGKIYTGTKSAINCCRNVDNLFPLLEVQTVNEINALNAGLALLEAADEKYHQSLVEPAKFERSVFNGN